MSLHVTCVNKPDRYSEHEHITHIGGSGWRKTREAVVYEINNNINSYYTKDPYTGQVAWVGVVNPSYGDPYLRTYADGDWNDNLLSLNECTLY